MATNRPSQFTPAPLKRETSDRSGEKTTPRPFPYGIRPQPNPPTVREWPEQKGTVRRG